jgi:hypothetical protein
MSTNADADLNRDLVCELPRQIYTMQLHISCSGVHDRYAQAPIRIDEEHGQTQLRLIHIAPPIALALRRPKLLWYNGTTGPNSIIEKPRILSMYRKSRRTIIRRRIKDIEGVILTDCLDRGYIHAEEIGYIGFRNSWAECVGNVIFTKVVRVMGGPQSARVAPLQDPALRGEYCICVDDVHWNQGGIWT